MASMTWRSALRRCLRPQFGLKGLFLTMTVAAVWTGVVVRRAREQQAAVRLIREQGGCVYYDFQERWPGSGSYDSKAKSDLPAWLLARFGEDFFADVVFASLEGRLTHDKKEENGNRSSQSAARLLPGLRKLEYLEFDDEEVTDEALRFVGELKNLERLFSFCDATRVTDAGIAHLARLQKLKHFGMLDLSITDESLKTFGRLRSLEGLALGGSPITDNGLKHLGDLTNLQFLGLGRCGGITDAGMASLGGLRHIECLELSGANLTSVGVERLKELQQLRSLNLSDNRELGDDALRVIADFSRLKELRLDNTKITSKGMKWLATLKELRALDVSGNRGVTDEGVAYLSDLKNLEELNLSNTRVGSSALRHLEGLEWLRTLDLSGNTAIDDAALPYLAKLVGLRDLDLRRTRLKLTRENSAQLKPLAALRFLELAETGSDSRAVQAVLPSCSVRGSQAETLSSPGALDYLSLCSEVQGLAMLRVEDSLTNMSDRFETHDFIPSPDSLPPSATLTRMISLTKTAGLEPTLAAQQPALEEFAGTLGQPPNLENSSDEQAQKLFRLAESDAALKRLYFAAIGLEFADRLSEHIDYLEKVQCAAGLTDVEQQEYQEALESRDMCLFDASQRLGLGVEASSDPLAVGPPGDAIIRIWKETQQIVQRTDGARAARR